MIQHSGIEVLNNTHVCVIALSIFGTSLGWWNQVVVRVGEKIIGFVNCGG